MLPLFILAIENDDDRQFVADIYTRYRPALYRLLKMCLKQLTQREIDILNYFYTLDLPQKEIAGLTGLTTGNVRLIISRAKKKVLAAYDERGGFDYE